MSRRWAALLCSLLHGWRGASLESQTGGGLYSAVAKNGHRWPRLTYGPATLAHSRTTVCGGIRIESRPRGPMRTRFALVSLSTGARGLRPAEDAIPRRRSAGLNVSRRYLYDSDYRTVPGPHESGSRVTCHGLFPCCGPRSASGALSAPARLLPALQAQAVACRR